MLANIESIQKEIRINASGQATVSIRGAARIVGVKAQTLTNHFQGDSFSDSKLAQSLTAKGFNGDSFSDGIPDIALALIVEYYAFDAGKRCTEQALLP